MAIEYKVEDKTYILSYQQLREEYHRFRMMTDDQFKENLPAALHLSIVICWMKEIPSEICLRDDGIVHELAHLIHIPADVMGSFRDIRKRFDETLELK